MNSTVKQSAPVVITAIIAIAAIEIYALSQGINGILLTGVVGVLAAIAGVKGGKMLEHRCMAKKLANGESEQKGTPNQSTEE